MAELPGTPVDVSDLQPCALCGRGVGHDGQIIFYEVNVAQCVIDVRNVQRMHGLEMMMGGAVAVARIFSPDNTVARRLPGERKLVCQQCFLERPNLAILMEQDDG